MKKKRRKERVGRGEERRKWLSRREESEEIYKVCKSICTQNYFTGRPCTLINC
jgi:hypothetical protein